MGKLSILRASILILPALVLGGGSGRADTKATAPPPAAGDSPIDPQAKDALTRMSEFFKSLSAFSIREDITREQVIDGDLKVEKASTADVVARRPNGLKAEVVGDDGKAHSIFYDGKTLSIFMPTTTTSPRRTLRRPSAPRWTWRSPNTGSSFPPRTSSGWPGATTS